MFFTPERLVIDCFECNVVQSARARVHVCGPVTMSQKRTVCLQQIVAVVSTLRPIRQARQHLNVGNVQ